MPAKELFIKKVNYRISPAGIKCDMNLGELHSFAQEILNPVRAIATEKELTQMNIKQLKHGIAADDETAIKVKIGSFTCPAATGNYSVTGVGFKPRYVEFMAGVVSDIGAYNNHGWMDYNGNQGAISSAVGAATHESRGAQYQSACIYFRNYPGEIVLAATFVSMNSDGFTINFVNTNATITIMWKCVR